MRTNRGVRALVAAGAIVALAAGCSGPSDDRDATAQMSLGSSAGDDSAEGEESAPTEADAGNARGAGGGVVAAPISVAAGEVQVVRTASLRVSVPEGDFGVAFASASQVATTLGGFVQSSSTSSYDEGRASGEVTIRVPVGRFDDAVEQLGALGEIESTQVDGDDVTGELVDMAARLRSMRAEEEALNALLLEATNVGEILTVRERLSNVRQAIEQLAAQEASLADRAAFSTVSVVLHEGGDALAASTDDGDWTLGDALATAVDGATSVVGAAIVVVGFAVPLLPLAAIAWLVVRRRRTAAAAA